MHDNIWREFILYIPASYTGNEAVPLLFNFHGYTSNATQQMWYGDFRPIADTAGFIIVHPEGTLDQDGNTHFNVGWGGSSRDDVGFSRDLLDTLSTRYNLDENRIYSTGMSNGGFMSYYLACQMSDRIAAVASVTGSMTPLQYNTCSPQHSTPVMQIHGTSDAVVPYNGASWTRSIPNVVDYWLRENNCNEAAQISQIPNTNTADNSSVELLQYGDGDNGAEVLLYKISNGGHTWPGNNVGGPGTNYDMDASLEIWNFFAQYDLEGLRNTTSIDDIEDPLFEIYPNPSSDFIRIKSEEIGEKSFVLLDMRGKQLISGNFRDNEFELDIQQLNEGIYFLKIGSRSIKILKRN